jgi:hypothetical protein
VNDKEAAHAHRLAQAQRILDLFETANGRPARNVEELEKWIASPEGEAILAINKNPQTGFIDPY